MASSKKSTKTNKTAHVLNVITGGHGQSDPVEEQAPAPASDPAVDSQAPTSRPPVTPILEIARADDDALSAAILNTLMEEVTGESTVATPEEAPTPQAPIGEAVEPDEIAWAAASVEESAPAASAPAEAVRQPEPVQADTAPQSEPVQVDTVPQSEPIQADTARQPEPTQADTAPQPEPVQVDTVPQPEPVQVDTVPQPEPVQVDTVPQSEPVQADAAPQPEPVQEDTAPQPELTQADTAPQTESAQEDIAIAEADDCYVRNQDIAYHNITQALVESKAEKYMKMVDMCCCPRCTADVKAKALCNLPPKYIVMHKSALTPMLSYYEGRFSAAVTAQIFAACQLVKENPRH